MHVLALEEVADVLDVHAQELERARVVVLDALADIDHDQLALVVEQVVLAQIGVHKATSLVQDAHVAEQLNVDVAPLGGHLLLGLGFEFKVAQARGWPALVVSEEAHDEDVGFEVDGFRAGDSGGVDAAQVTEFLLGPDLNHGAVRGLVVALLEAELAGDVLFSVLEDHDAGLVDFDGAVESDSRGVAFGLGDGGSMVDVRFFAGGDDTVDLAHDVAVEDLQQQHASPRIQDLLASRAIALLGATLGFASQTGFETGQLQLCRVGGEGLDMVVDGGSGVELRVGLRFLCLRYRRIVHFACAVERLGEV